MDKGNHSVLGDHKLNYEYDKAQETKSRRLVRVFTSHEWLGPAGRRAQRSAVEAGGDIRRVLGRLRATRINRKVRR